MCLLRVDFIQFLNLYSSVPHSFPVGGIKYICFVVNGQK